MTWVRNMVVGVERKRRETVSESRARAETVLLLIRILLSSFHSVGSFVSVADQRELAGSAIVFKLQSVD